MSLQSRDKLFWEMFCLRKALGQTQEKLQLQSTQNGIKIKRRLLGMVTYLTKSIPQLSTHSVPLGCLLEQKNECVYLSKSETHHYRRASAQLL